jgi:hypothetical protein
LSIQKDRIAGNLFVAVNLVARFAGKLRKRFPGPKVKIVRAKQMFTFATCHFDDHKNVFIITLDKELKEDIAVFLLAHEWAHTLSWGLDGFEIAHGPAFWTAYEKTYAVYEEFTDTHNKDYHE